MDPGESIKQACEREVYEETGIHCDFVGLLGIRELLGFKYGCADLYIVCLMKLRGESEEEEKEAARINIQDKREVFAAQWLPVQELSSNQEGVKYKLFQNAYQFVSGIHKLYTEESARNGGEGQQVDLFSAVKAVSQTYSEFEPKSVASAKYTPTGPKDSWKYYLPEQFRKLTQSQEALAQTDESSKL